MTYLLLVLGFILLIKGADFFVDGSSKLAKYFRIPSVVIGLTLVAIGTSLPELAVSLTAALKHSSDLSVSNIIGSNLFNLFVILGITSLFKPVIAESSIHKDYKISILSALSLLVIILLYHFISGIYMIGRIGGIFLLLFLVYYVGDMIRNLSIVKESSRDRFEIKNVILIIIGIFMIVLGGELTVNHAVMIAKELGLSERFIGLTIVAIGTSLPELCTSLVALLKGENDIAVGNILGSNIFNILLILGTSSFISPLLIHIESIIDLMIFIIGSIFVLLFLFNDLKISRKEGLVMLFLYLSYSFYIFFR